MEPEGSRNSGQVDPDDPAEDHRSAEQPEDVRRTATSGAPGPAGPPLQGPPPRPRRGRPRIDHQTCQIEGCKADMNRLGPYHRVSRLRSVATVCARKGSRRSHDSSLFLQRYRVCDVHMRALVVEHRGQLCRFCQQVSNAKWAAPLHSSPSLGRQRVCVGKSVSNPPTPPQCGRFQELSAFDGDHRSCRDRLQRHAGRRRRQLETLARKRRSLTSPTSSGGTAGIYAACARCVSFVCACQLTSPVHTVSHCRTGIKP